MNEQQELGAVEGVNLWSDEPSLNDLLAFDALALTLIDPLLDESLAPIALGISGPWGSGKSTVLSLIERHLDVLSTDDSKILVVSTQPWRYDPGVGAKETLIGEVIAKLQDEVMQVAGPAEHATGLLTKLTQRVDWAKALKVAAKAGIAMQIPSVEQVLELIKPPTSGEGESSERGLDSFRSEFAELMASEDLKHVKGVVVLVDDLDRCLPRTVVESLEAIRLFLAVPKMSFVIAADEQRVADALRVEFPRPTEPRETDAEDPAELYLHKIVQTTLPIPALNSFDTQAYILLLQVQAGEHSSELERLVEVCGELRRRGKSFDDMEASDATLLAPEISFAARLTPVLYEKLRGNPRRIKRFLNDLYVRRAVARRRGIELDAAVIAKLMILEVLFKDDFNTVLDWLGKGELRSKIAELEVAAGRPESAKENPQGEGDPARKSQQDKPPKKGTKADDKDAAPEADTRAQFSESMLRWAKLPPSLRGLDLASYLYLAASFTAAPVIDSGLPERLKDLAANLLGSTRREREAVSNADLQALLQGDIDELVNHLGRVVRDQPSQQRVGVTALLRIARNCQDGPKAAARALSSIPVADLTFGTPLLFTANDAPEIKEILEQWHARSNDGQVKTSIKEALKAGG